MSLDRKIKRKQQRNFLKEFKKRMKGFKEMVKCAQCSRRPDVGENIDNWYINEASENIDLICTDCHSSKEALSHDG